MDKKYPAIPVLYYHSIGNHQSATSWSFLSYPYRLFHEHIKYLHKRKYTTITLRQLYDYMSNKIQLNQKSVVITFDDGFLDNWVFAYPILRKYGMKATVYVNPDFISEEDIVHPTLEDVWNGHKSESELRWWGYLSWEELRIMQKSGVIDVESHSLTHTWYFANNKIIDFHHPKANYQWLYWNEIPENKPYWLDKFAPGEIEYGRPIYEHGKALITKRYFEDNSLKEQLTDHIKKNGNEAFFKNDDWRQELYKVVEQYKKTTSLTDYFETDTQYEARIYEELNKSKEIISEKLNKEVHFLCWPGGGTNKQTTAIAKKVGYLSTTKGSALNRPGSDPSQISRVSAILPINFPLFRTIIDLFILTIQLSRGQGKLIVSTIGKVFKSIYRKLH